VVVGAGNVDAPWWVVVLGLLLVIALAVHRLWSGERLDHDAKTGFQLQVLRGWEAKRFAKKQLEEMDTDAAAGTTSYRDPADGSTWVMDYPPGEAHPPRLRRLRD